ncbi:MULTISPECIES: hypothetical protein [Achromobacter]|uniref:hypothetical protein n=1 Tax=Achromobacter TaxID=222 RepID=UPI001EF37A8A|nr:hypothetical protein [Achromobacter sp. ACRQX]MCG7327258.1 hypothetical protein [Achromobacter sp. ACRQX]
MFPDTFWLKAGIAQALPAFLHLRGLFLQEVQCKRCAARSALQEAHWQEAPRIAQPPVVCHVVHRPAIYYRPMKTQACLVLIMVRADPVWCIFFILPDAITK